MLDWRHMKQRSTTPVSKTSFAMRACVVAATILTLSVAPFTTVPPAKADSYDDKIAALQQQVDQYSQTASQLSQQRQTLQGELNVLDAQRAQIQAELDLNNAKAAQLTQQIADNQTKLEQNQSLLGDIIANMYIDGNITPLEMLASSSNISDYADKLANQDQVKSNLNQTIKDINTLKSKLEKQKKDLDVTIQNQQSMTAELQAKENEKQQLISQTQGQEAAFQALIGQQNAQITQLRAEQAAANARFIGGANYAAGTGPACGGGYPGRWCNIPMDSVSDDWGMYNRECVSYTAFRVAASGRNMPYWGGRGNANQWVDNARSAGIPYDYSSGAKAGDVAIYLGGPYGHAMYVDSVNSNGTINISQYNADFYGTYSTNTISQNNLYFIHFR